MPSQITAVLILSLSLLAQDDPSAKTAPTDEEIARAVRELGDDDYSIRERASEFLWQAGRAAEPALHRALKSEDIEVVARARRILSSFQYGIYPDTPAETARLITRFRYGNHAAKQAALKELRDTDRMPALLMLLKREPDETVRKKLTDALVKDLDKVVGKMLVEENWARLERLLEMGSVTDGGMRDYAAFLLLRDQLEAKISKIENRVGDSPGEIDAAMLVYLLRAKGDLSAARLVAEKASDPALLGGILFELGDWKELARRHNKISQSTTQHVAGGIVQLGYAAAFNRLAGNREAFEKAVGEIRQYAKRKPNKLWDCGEALLINERFPEAVELLKESRLSNAFEILNCQRRFREAMKLAGIDDPRGPASPWFADADSPSQSRSSQKRDRFSLGLRVASTLYRLGETQRAADLFAELARAAENDRDFSMRAICEAEYKLGLTEQAFEHTAVVLSKSWNALVFHTLFSDRSSTAEFWWAFLCRKYLDEPREKTVARLRHVLAVAPSKDVHDQSWLPLVEEAEEDSREFSQSRLRKTLTALGETCLAHGKAELAQTYFKKAAEAAPSVELLTKVGDLLLADAQWQQAALWYQKAWEQDRTKPTALYLEGHALIQAGHESEGRKRITAARLLPLGDAEARYALAQDLQARGLTEGIADQWKVILRTGEFQSQAITQAAAELGDLAEGKDDLQAAAYWQWSLLRCLRTNRPAQGIEGHLNTLYRIHKARARGLLAAGKIDTALEEIRLAHAARPGEITLALDLVPRLEKQGRQTEADELFARALEVNRRVCEDFPRSATDHSNLAWLAARCKRQLDEALQHAQKAVELARENPAYMNTLAEVHFQRGDRDQAVELARRCVELAPQSEHFREQLKRFQAP